MSGHHKNNKQNNSDRARREQLKAQSKKHRGKGMHGEGRVNPTPKQKRTR